LLPQGDICRYSLQLNNNTDAPVRGLAWSIVVGSRLTLHSIRGQHAGRVKAGCSRASRLRAARQRDRGVSV
jgi:hypothetical protein